MIVDGIFAVLTAIVFVIAAFSRPTHARCPRGWWLPEGIRRSGEFTCRPAPVGGDDDALTGRDTATQSPAELSGQIYCTGGAVPVVNGDRVVGCQREPGS